MSDNNRNEDVAPHAGQPEPHETIEMLLPLRLNNDDRGSDLNRARDGLIASLNRFCDPHFVNCLTIIVPADDLLAARELASECSIDVRVIPEGELIAIDAIGNIPRRGWYIQQLIKLAYANICKTPFYITLDADVFLINPLDAGTFRNGKAPIKLESTSAHSGWWSASVEVLEQKRSAHDFDAERAFGVTPGFLNTEVTRGMLRRLDDLARLKNERNWLNYLCNRTSMENDCWTEYSLYWTYLINKVEPSNLYFPFDVYFYTESTWQAAQMLESAEQRSQYLFCILQSSFVDDQSHARLVKQFLSGAMT